MTLKALANFSQNRPREEATCPISRAKSLAVPTLGGDFVNFGRRFQRHSDDRTGGSAQTMVHDGTGNIDRANGQPAIIA
jgi:hypothetical protein